MYITYSTVQQHVDIHCLHYAYGGTVVEAWVQSRQLGTHKHFFFSQELFNGYVCITPHFIGLCEGWYSKFPWLSCDSSFYHKGTI